MGYMFGYSIFDQDISTWNTGRVTYMANIFYNNASFDQNLSGWNVGFVENFAEYDTGASSWAQVNKPIW
jgi:hypothetical protein